MKWDLELIVACLIFGAGGAILTITATWCFCPEVMWAAAGKVFIVITALTAFYAEVFG